MSQEEYTSETITIDEFQRRLNQIVDEVAAGKTRVTIERDGEALVRMEPAVTREQREIDALMRDPGFRQLAAISEATKHLPLDELEAQVAKGLREGRERRRRERERAKSNS